MRTVLTIGVLMIATPALAYPTEVDPGELRDKRLATVRHYRQETRERAEARQPSPTPASGSALPRVSAPTPGPIAAYLRAAGFPEEVIPTMVQIALRESGGDPSAVNGGGPAYAGGPACGLLQLYPCPGPEALDPWTNAALAYKKYLAAGLSPWGY